MVKHTEINELNDEVKVDKDHAQILINIVPSKKTFEELKIIIEESGAHIIETKNVLSNWVLIKLDVRDMRGIALRLTERGVFEMKGYNASSLKI